MCRTCSEQHDDYEREEYVGEGLCSTCWDMEWGENMHQEVHDSEGEYYDEAHFNALAGYLHAIQS
jgi:hypothetical protein